MDIKGDAGTEIGVDELDKKPKILDQQGSSSTLERAERRVEGHLIGDGEWGMAFARLWMTSDLHSLTGQTLRYEATRDQVELTEPSVSSGKRTKRPLMLVQLRLQWRCCVDELSPTKRDPKRNVERGSLYTSTLT